MLISSVDNKKIKEVKKLRVNKFMDEKQRFIIEGEHLVLEASKSGLLLETFSTSKITSYGVSNTLVTESVMRLLSSLPSAPKVIGICRFIPEKETLGNRILVLDGVQDPGNLGTIIRSACAFNFDTVVLSANAVRKYNEKVVRATQGMLFKVNVITRELTTFVKELENLGYAVYKTDVTGGKNLNEIDNKHRLVVVMGSEGQGVSNAVKGIIANSIYIPMNERCESLNVAVASSIIMYELGVEK